jgi:sugar phosphate isomerase/epimerase
MVLASPSTSTTCGGTRNCKRRSKRAGAADRLFAYHICDWLVPTTDLLNDRGMMGDGVIDLPRVRGWMEAAGYRGLHEVEIFSNRWWAEDPVFVLATCIERHQRCT